MDSVSMNLFTPLVADMIDEYLIDLYKNEHPGFSCIRELAKYRNITQVRHMFQLSHRESMFGIAW